VAFETIRGESGVDFVGTAAVDSLFVLNESGNISVEGLAGNDLITIANTSGVIGTTTVKGGEGNDTLTFALQGDSQTQRLDNSSVNGGAGNDTFTLEGAVSSVIRGNEGRDNFNLSGNYTSVTVNGNSGEDTFTGDNSVALSNAKIIGGNDNDGGINLGNIVSAVDSTVNGSKGSDVITLGTVTTATNFTVFGGQGNDVITTNNAGADGIVLSGDNGADNISGGGANEVINGGADADILAGGGGNDTIDGGDANDNISGGGGDDVTSGGAGNDTFTDAAGDDTITGGAGADTYTTAGGDNIYIIGSGDSAPTTTNASQGFDTFGAGFAAGTDTINISSLTSSLLGDAASGGTTVTFNEIVGAVAGASPDAQALAAATPAVAKTFGNVNATAVASSTFAELSARLTNGLIASTATNLSVQFITVAGDGAAAANLIDGTYAIINNRTTSLDAGDVMIEVNAADIGDFFTVAEYNAALIAVDAAGAGAAQVTANGVWNALPNPGELQAAGGYSTMTNARGSEDNSFII
jgi:Ca2+-binding RTX toxin-like protein